MAVDPGDQQPDGNVAHGTEVSRPVARERIAGIVLAGGQSRRMGGGDKTLLHLAGRPMLQHVIDAVRPQVARLALNANGDAARFAPFGLDVEPDPIDGFVGPLAGVLAGMAWARRTAPEVDHIATVSGDAPFLPADLVQRLSAALNAPAQTSQDAPPTGLSARPRIALARSDGHLHPVIGLWPVALHDDLAAALNDGVRKVLHWTDRHGTLGVDFAMMDTGGEVIDPFFNANKPEDLARAQAILEAMR
ncbi:MAG: molybdenum cofactor guanylyltransferase MobA [Pseudomonadota bacterium]